MLICSSNFQAVNNYSISIAKIKIIPKPEVPNIKRPAQQEKISAVDYFSRDYVRVIQGKFVGLM